MRINGFNNVNIVFPDGVRKGSVSIEGDKIVSLTNCKDGIELPDNLYVAPGFIDEHIHGAGGADTMDAKISSLETMATALVQEGVTSFTATTMTEGLDKIKAALSNIHEYMGGDHPGARVIGAHMEGPFISKQHAGAQDPKNILQCDVAIFKDLERRLKGNITEVTFALEENGFPLLDYLLKQGVTPSIGHSDCTADVFKKGIASGLSCVTHLFNAQRGFHHRDPGIVGEALVNDGVKTELICDFIHSNPDAVKLVARTKRKEDVVLISDSTEGKYLAPGKYELGGQDVFIYDGVARLKDGTIAGSILKLDQALRNYKSVAQNYSYSDLINLVTLNVAKNIHKDNLVGSIAVGHFADFAILDEDFNVYGTIVGGEVAYRKRV
jgi:N-acetylglucosamine-6-phosphate deacetylase